MLKNVLKRIVLAMKKNAIKYVVGFSFIFSVFLITTNGFGLRDLIIYNQINEINRWLEVSANLQSALHAMEELYRTMVIDSALVRDFRFGLVHARDNVRALLPALGGILAELMQNHDLFGPQGLEEFDRFYAFLRDRIEEMRNATRVAGEGYLNEQQVQAPVEPQPLAEPQAQQGAPVFDNEQQVDVESFGDGNENEHFRGYQDYDDNSSHVDQEDYDDCIRGEEENDYPCGDEEEDDFGNDQDDHQLHNQNNNQLHNQNSNQFRNQGEYDRDYEEDVYFQGDREDDYLPCGHGGDYPYGGQAAGAMVSQQEVLVLDMSETHRAQNIVAQQYHRAQVQRFDGACFKD